MMFGSLISSFALAASGTDMEISERASIAGTVTLEGMLMIFCALTLLWIAIEIMHFVLHHKSGTKKIEKVSSAPVASRSSVPPTAVSPAPVNHDGALIAAITAAISAAMAEEGYTGGFRVVSFKRVSSQDRKNRF